MKRNSKKCDRQKRPQSLLTVKAWMQLSLRCLTCVSKRDVTGKWCCCWFFTRICSPLTPCTSALPFNSAFCSLLPLHRLFIFLPTLLTSARSPPPSRTRWPSRIFEISLKLKCCSVLPCAWPPGTENKSASVSVCSEKLCFRSRPVASHTQYAP